MTLNPRIRRSLARGRRTSATTRAPGNPTYGMEWWDPSTGVTKTYHPPGVWKTVSGGVAEWELVSDKPETFPPSTHLHPEKQDTLVSGSNIKTVNGASILGPGNIVVEAGSQTVVVGPTGADGTDGADGVDGADGKSAFQLATELGFSGTEAEWISLISDSGFPPPHISSSTQIQLDTNKQSVITVAGSYFTEDMIVSSPGIGAVSYKFINSNTAELTITTNSTAGSFNLTLNNGKELTALGHIVTRNPLTVMTAAQINGVIQTTSSTASYNGSTVALINTSAWSGKAFVPVVSGGGYTGKITVDFTHSSGAMMLGFATQSQFNTAGSLYPVGSHIIHLSNQNISGQYGTNKGAMVNVAGGSATSAEKRIELDVVNGVSSQWRMFYGPGAHAGGGTLWHTCTGLSYNFSSGIGFGANGDPGLSINSITYS